MRYALALMLALALSACVTVEQRRQARAQADDQQCSSFGLTAGTSAYADCRLRLQAQRTAERQAESDRYAHVAEYFQRMNQQQLNAAPVMQAPQLPQTTNCRWVFNVWRCDTR